MSNLLEIVPVATLNDLSQKLTVFLDRFSSPDARDALLQNVPFAQQTKKIGVLSLGDEVTPTVLQSGETASITLGGNAGAELRLELVWPGDAFPAEWTSIVTAKFAEAPTDGDFLVLLTMGGTVGAKVNGTAKSTWLHTTYGLETSGSLRVLRAARFKKNERAREVLATFLGGLRWPLRTLQNTSDFLPGEVIAAEVVGDLKATIRVAGGVEFSGGLDVAEGAKPIGFKYRGSLSLFASAGVNVTGAFRIISKAGAESGWVRVCILKESSRGASFSAGLDLSVKWLGENIPAEPTEALSLLIGVDASAAVTWIDKIAGAASKDDALKAISDALSPAVSDLVGDALAPLLTADTAASYAKIRASVKKLGDRLKGLPDEVAAFVVKQVPNSERVQQLLEKASKALADPQGMLDNEYLAVLWPLAETVLGEDLAHPELRAKLAARAKQAADALSEGVDGNVKELVGEFIERTQIDDLAEKIVAIFEPKDLEALAEQKTKMLVTHLLELGKGALDGVITDETFAKAKAGAQKLRSTLGILRSALKKASEGSLELSLVAAFETRRGKQAVFEAEFDISHPDGRDALSALYDGDLTAALDRAIDDADGPLDDAVVRLSSCVFTDARTRTTSLALTVGNWSWKRSITYAQTLREEFVQREGGMILLQTIEAQQTVKKSFGVFDRDTTLQAYTLLRAYGEGSAKDRGHTSVADFTTSLGLVVNVEKPGDKDIDRVLETSWILGLIDDPALVRERLKMEFGSRILRISASYRASFAPLSLRAALEKMGEAQVVDAVQKHLRAFIGAAFVWGIRASERKSYLDFNLFGNATEPCLLSADDAKRRRDWVERCWKPKGMQGKKSSGTQLGFSKEFRSWYDVEIGYLEALKALKEMTANDAAAVTTDKVFEAFKKILGAKPWLASSISDRCVPFLVLDQIVRAHEPKAREGRTALLLEITVAGDNAANEPIRRHYLC